MVSIVGLCDNIFPVWCPEGPAEGQAGSPPRGPHQQASTEPLEVLVTDRTQRDTETPPPGAPDSPQGSGARLCHLHGIVRPSWNRVLACCWDVVEAEFFR